MTADSLPSRHALLRRASTAASRCDPVAALIMVPIIANEGVEALRGETCEDGCA